MGSAAAAAAAAAPPPLPTRFSTGAGIDFPASAGDPSLNSQLPSTSSHPTLDRGFDLATLPLALRMLAAACGLEAPTRVQSGTWAVAMKGGKEEKKGGMKNDSSNSNNNLLIVAPPGAGKTLAYLLPAAAKVVVDNEVEESEEEDEESDDDDAAAAERRLHKKTKKSSSSSPSSTSSLLPSPRVLVLVPTRELARQVTAAARPLRRASGLKVVRVAGGDRREDQVDKLRSSSSKGKGGESSVHVLVATPGRLLDLVRGGDVGLGEFFFPFGVFLFGSKRRRQRRPLLLSTPPLPPETPPLLPAA